MPNNNNNNAVSSSFLLPLSTASSIQTYLKSSGFHDDDFFVSASSVSSAVSSTAHGGISFNLHVLWRKLYEDLASLAFSTASIEDAFRTLLQLVRPNQLTRLHLIDFLIVNTPLQKLPTDVRGAASQWTTSSNTFETSSGTEETAAIKYVAQPQTKQTQQQFPPPQPQPPPPQAISKKRATEDADADAAKAFIRNMTFDDSDSDESADSSSSAAASSSAAHFEPSDDPLCDPLGPPWRRKLTFEYARARRTATSAKDAQAKKLAGQQIGKCKREAREAKLDAAVLDALAEPLLRHWDELGRAPWEEASSSPPPPPSPPQENSEEEDEAPPTLDLDLFVQDDDDTSNTTTWRPPPPPPTAASALLNPSALLQSVCSRLNSKAPRFDQLKGGGMAVRLWASGPRRKNASTASGSHAFEATLSDASSLHPDATPRELACVRALVGLLEPAGGALAVSAQGVSAEAVELERVRCYHSLKDDWARDAWSKACGGILEGEENAPRAQLDEDARRNEFIEELISTISPSSQPQYHDPSKDDEQQQRQQQHNMRSRTTTTNNRPTGQWPPPHPDNPLLPAHALRDAIIDTARSCPAMVITGETGSGKSTQVPQFILDGADGNANILVCQPRRVAAMSLAARVAAERGEASPGGVSGYHIRGSRVASSRTRVLFATCGMALRLLRDGGDEIFTHVVVDEVHERSIETDLLLALLSRMRRRRANTARELGVLLMSATCDVDMWLRYLGSGSRHVHIEGRTFPVTTLYLDDILPGRALAALGAAIHQQEDDDEEDQDDEDNDSYSDSNDGASIVDATSSPLSLSIASYQPSPDESEDDVCTSTDLLCASIEMADDALSEQEAASGALRGSILVFLPSIAQCESLAEMLRGSRRFGADGKGEWIVALHSRSDAETQKRAFAIVPEKARCRKVVVATNVAEASVTIADVACVVDTGREKRIVHRRRRGTSQLMERWVSRQSARQRAGRAGRTRKGLCIRLYTRQRHDEGMAAARAPEMRVARLDRALMECIAYAPTARDLGELIAALPEPPEASSTIAAWSDLRELGAVDGDMDVAMLSQQSATLTVDTGDGSVTSLGRVLCELPCAPAVSKMVVLASALGCLSPVLSIASALATEAGERVLGARGGGSPSWLQRCAAPLPTSADARKRDARVELFGEPAVAWAASGHSDILCLASLWCMCEKLSGGGAQANKRRAFVAASGMSRPQMTAWREMRSQLADQLMAARVLPPRSDADDVGAPWNAHSRARDRNLVSAVVAACLSSAVAMRDGPAWSDGRGPVTLAASSAFALDDRSPLMCHARKDGTSWSRAGKPSVARASGAGPATPVALVLLGGRFGCGTLTSDSVGFGLLGAPPATVRCGPDGALRVQHTSPASARLCQMLRKAGDKEISRFLDGDGDRRFSALDAIAKAVL